MYILENFGNPKGKLGSLLIKMMNKGHRKLHLWGISYLNVNDGDNILDIGCGGGSAIKIISEKYSSCNIYGIDISEKSIEKASILNKEKLNKQVYLNKSSVLSTPYKNDYFDIVVSFESIYFWKDLHNAFKEIYRIMKPNSKIYVFMEVLRKKNAFWEKFIKNMKEYSYEEIKYAMECSGFKNISLYSKSFTKNMIAGEK